MEFLTLEKLSSYKKSYQLSNFIWNITLSWENFAKWTIGVQLVKATDSISANIAEGFGRYHKKEKIHFYRYSYGSLLESLDWVRKAKDRNLIEEVQAEGIYVQLEELKKEVNYLIKFTNEKLKY